MPAGAKGAGKQVSASRTTDIDMPGGVDGLKLAVSVRVRWPPITIIVTSGLRAVGVESLPVRARFMPKPYNPNAVVRSIKEMMTQ